jgi:non-reducing end alpha-L-arabinofuranosidase
MLHVRPQRRWSRLGRLALPVLLISACATSDGTIGGSGGGGAEGGSSGSTGSGGGSGGSSTGGSSTGGKGSGGLTGSGGSSSGGAVGTGGGSGGTTTGKGGTGGGSSGGAVGTGGGSGGTTTGKGGSGGSGIGGGAAGASGNAGAGGATTSTGMLPGDIASAASTPMVAAHSVTRAMYAAYSGKLFQAQRASDNKTQDISAVSAGGLVDLNALGTFCSGTTCTVARLYDQAGNGNDMWQTAVANQPTVGFWTSSGGTQYPMVVSAGSQWLRNRLMTKKIPTGAAPQTEYFVVHGANAGNAAGTNGCCYDYGNMEKYVGDDGPGTMTALYFGKATDWTRGAGNGPWVMLDMENGVFAGGGAIAILNSGNASVNSSDPSLMYPSPNIVTGLAKTNGTSTFEIKYGNASTGALSIAWNGSLPTNTNPTSYIPLQQEGGISLGEGGDGSAMGTGAFSEGAIIAAQTSDATDDAIQANLTTLYK